MTENRLAFIKALTASDPALRRVMDQHLDENLGQVLPYLYIADVRRLVERLADTGDLGGAQVILDILEQSLIAGGATADELIGVSFIELLDNSVVKSMIRSRYAALARILDDMQPVSRTGSDRESIALMEDGVRERADPPNDT